MKLPMKLQGLLRIVPMSDYEELSNIRDYLVKARLTAEEQADNNSRLCADLVEECNSQGKIIDELSDENAKLKEQLAKAGQDMAQLEEAYEILRHRLLHLSEAIASIHNITEECDDYAEMV